VVLSGPFREMETRRNSTVGHALKVWTRRQHIGVRRLEVTRWRAARKVVPPLVKAVGTLVSSPVRRGTNAWSSWCFVTPDSVATF